MPKSFWKQQKDFYTMLSNLIQFIDNELSTITTFAIFNDLYFILIQLLNTFQ